MIRLIFLILCFSAAPLAAVSQTPSTSYTFTSDDIFRSLTPPDQKELKRIQDELRDLQKLGRSHPPGSLERRSYLNEFERVKAEREEKFGFIRGINGTTITFWGQPVPAAENILASVLRERKDGGGDGILYPHYYYDEISALRGSNAPPPNAGEAADAAPGVSGADLAASGLVVTSEDLSSLERGEDDCDKSSYAFGTSALECD